MYEGLDVERSVTESVKNYFSDRSSRLVIPVTEAGLYRVKVTRDALFDRIVQIKVKAQLELFPEGDA